MEVSIILPVYNGEETILECINAILRIEYDKEKYELIIIDDASSDSTRNILKNLISNFHEMMPNMKVLKHEKNEGRIRARKTGVDAAKFDNLLFIDHRCIVDNNILQLIRDKKYQPIIGNLYQDNLGTIINKFFYVFRSLLYHPYFGISFPDVFINKSNFHNISKGFSPFFCNKDTFLRSLPQCTGKMVNDDTLIFSQIVTSADILKTSDVKCIYREREKIKDVLKHLFERGPRFFDFYFNVVCIKGIFLYLLIFSPIFWILLYQYFNFLSLIVMGLAIYLVTLSLLCYRYKIQESLCFLTFLPIVYVVFSAGVYRGLLEKIRKMNRS